jgi:hypothetical protein
VDAAALPAEVSQHVRAFKAAADDFARFSKALAAERNKIKAVIGMCDPRLHTCLTATNPEAMRVTRTIVTDEGDRSVTLYQRKRRVAPKKLNLWDTSQLVDRVVADACTDAGDVPFDPATDIEWLASPQVTTYLSAAIERHARDLLDTRARDVAEIRLRRGALRPHGAPPNAEDLAAAAGVLPDEDDDDEDGADRPEDDDDNAEDADPEDADDDGDGDGDGDGE